MESDFLPTSHWHKIFASSVFIKSKSKETNGHETSKPEKFDQVEDALEAMFGLEELSGIKDIPFD